MEDDVAEAIVNLNALQHTSLQDFHLARRSGEKTLMVLVRQEWEKLVSSNVIQDRLFPCVAVEEIIQTVLDWWLDTELYLDDPIQHIQHERSVAAGILITGTTGVGKTTIMLGLRALIAKFGTRVKSAYVSYDLNKTKPSEFLTDAPVTILCSPEGPNAYDSWAAGNRTAFMFFGDEIHHLYDNNEYISIVGEFLCLGKARYGFGVVSGSSANTKSLAFKENPNDKKHLGYANLNNSVYRTCPLNPVRTREELLAVLRFKQRTASFSPTYVYYHTGGVGRYIDRYNANTSIAIPNILEVVADDKYDTLIRAFLSLNFDSNDSFGLQGLYMRTAQHCCREPVERLRELQDMHILYQSSDGRFELLIPRYYDILRTYFRAVPTRLQELALETTLKGWQGFGSAGQVLEPLVLNSLINLKRLHFHLAVDTACKELSITALTNGTNIEDLCGKVWIPVPNNGLDSCLFIKSNANTIDVYTSQLKFGEFNKKITNPARGSDASRHFGAIVEKAKLGWTDLHNSMKSQYPELNFVCKEFVLVTNKAVEGVNSGTVSIMSSGQNSILHIYDKADFDEDFESILKSCNLAS